MASAADAAKVVGKRHQLSDGCSIMVKEDQHRDDSKYAQFNRAGPPMDESIKKFVKWEAALNGGKPFKTFTHLLPGGASVAATPPSPADVETLNWCLVEDRSTVRFTIKNTANLTPLTIDKRKVKVTHFTPGSSSARFKLQTNASGKVTLAYNQSVTFYVDITPKTAIKHIGKLCVPTDKGEIGFMFEVLAATPDMMVVDHDDGAGRSHNNKPPVWDGEERVVIRAFPKSRPNLTHVHTDVITEWESGCELNLWPIPRDVAESIDTADRYSKLPPWELKEKHQERMHYLLWIEEQTVVKQFRRFDLGNVTFTRTIDQTTNTPLHVVEVAGLAERRPSLMKGDVIFVWVPGTVDFEYEGFVHSVQQKTIEVIFCVDFDENVRTKYLFEFGAAESQPTFNVRFSFGRLQYRRMHQAVHDTLLSVLWPDHKPMLNNVVTPSGLEWTDHCIRDNDQQAHAVADILNLLHCDVPAPFILRGGFGTGKSRTLCEIAWQAVVTEDLAMPILICTEANGAADMIVESLANKSRFGHPDAGRYEDQPESKRLLRFNAIHRKHFTVSEIAKQHSHFDAQTETYKIPTKAQFWSDFDVVVTTFDNAAVLYGIGLKGAFRMILCDESSQALEPRVLIPLALADEKTVCVVAGDDRQISPKVTSRQAARHGLGTSIISRLVNHWKYNGGVELSQCDALKSPHGCTLFRNYRSHTELVDIASKLFYEPNGEKKLIASINPKHVNQFENWDMLPSNNQVAVSTSSSSSSSSSKAASKTNVPLMFVSVKGVCEQVPHDTSWFNRYEANKVVDLVEQLMARYPKECGFKGEHIGVVSGFRLQERHIRQRLMKTKHKKVKCAPVETLQGQELKVIIISTVRTKPTLAASDANHHLGFMHDEGRLNTVITRASSLLIVVGDENVLGHDPTWSRFIGLCKAKDSFLPSGVVPPLNSGGVGSGGSSGGGDGGSGRAGGGGGGGARAGAGESGNLLSTSSSDDNDSDDDDWEQQLDRAIKQKEFEERSKVKPTPLGKQQDVAKHTPLGSLQYEQQPQPQHQPQQQQQRQQQHHQPQHRQNTQRNVIMPLLPPNAMQAAGSSGGGGGGVPTPIGSGRQTTPDVWSGGAMSAATQEPVLATPPGIQPMNSTPLLQHQQQHTQQHNHQPQLQPQYRQQHGMAMPSSELLLEVSANGAMFPCLRAIVDHAEGIGAPIWYREPTADGSTISIVICTFGMRVQYQSIGQTQLVLELHGLIPVTSGLALKSGFQAHVQLNTPPGYYPPRVIHSGSDRLQILLISSN